MDYGKELPREYISYNLFCRDHMKLISNLLDNSFIYNDIHDQSGN